MPIPLHRVRFAWGPSSQIDIEWTKGEGEQLQGFVPTPLLTFCEREIAPDDYAQRGIPAICWRDDSPVLFEPLQLRENTDYFIDITLPLSKAEAERQARLRPAWPFSERLRGVFAPDPPRRWREPDPLTVVISGQLRLRNHAGIIDLTLENGAELRAEVICRKIGYLTEFQTLLGDWPECENAP